MSKVPRPIGHKHRRIYYENTEHPVHLTFVHIVHGKHIKKHKRPKPLCALVDSGVSTSIICKKQLYGNKRYHSKETKWKTTVGEVNTHGRSKHGFFLSEFSDSRKTTHDFHEVNAILPNYDMIIRRDLMYILKLYVQFNTGSLEWFEYGSIPLKPLDETLETHFYINDPDDIISEADKIPTILDTKYEKSDLGKISKSTPHLNGKEQVKLKALLQKYEELFDGTLGTCKIECHHVELREDIKPYHDRPYQVPKVYEKALRNEIERLVKLNVLKKVNHSEWGDPCFPTPKKDGTIRFITDFRELNKKVKRTHFPLPKIQDMLLKMEVFKYTTSLDLKLGYYNIKLYADSRKLYSLSLLNQSLNTWDIG